jgi:formylglycine-generating enzyme required for sulfatase activity
MKLELEWVEIPGGKFSTGTTHEESLRLSSKYKSSAFFREVPEKIIHVATFWITKYPITNRQFKVFSESTHSHATPIFMGCSDETLDHPVRYLSYYDAVAFCQWASCRLPTQTEWEKAAGGPNGLIYPW